MHGINPDIEHNHVKYDVIILQVYWNQCLIISVKETDLTLTFGFA